MRGISFDVRKVRAISLPHGLSTSIMNGRKYIAVKQPRPHEDRRVSVESLDEIAVELQVLRHEKVRQHDNIIQFLGLLYHNAGDKEAPHILPALALEWAEFGTLQDFQKEGFGKSIQDKYDICRDVALGLECLHDIAISHGDVKSTNMLVCKHPSRSFIVKLSDFGFAASTVEDGESRLVGHTLAFAAPETSSLLSRQLLTRLDIYSYGLLVHAVLRNGRIFHDDFCEQGGDDEQFQNIKNVNLLPDMLQLNLLNSMGQQRCLLLFFCKIVMYCTQASPADRFWEMKDIIGLLSWANPKDLDLSINRENPVYKVIQFPVAFYWDSRKRLMKLFDDALSKMEQRLASPMKPILVEESRRRLLEEFEMIHSKPASEYDMQYDFCGGLDLCVWRAHLALSPYPSDSHRGVLPGYVESPLQIMKDIRPDLSLHQEVLIKLPIVVQDFILQELTESSECSPRDERQRATALYNLAFCHVEGIGVPVDIARGLELLWEGASLGSTDARHHVFRLWESNMDWTDEQLARIVEWPEVKAVRSAKLLARWERFQGSEAAHKLRDQWNLANAIDCVPPQSRPISACGLLPWPASIVHFGAWNGLTELAGGAIRHDESLVNARNDLGQTPLIVACQGGQYDIATLFIEHGADVQLADNNGFTGLHWLISFREDEAEILANLLLAGGADLNASGRWPAGEGTTVPSLRGAPSRTDGTPLHWAVAQRNRHLSRLLVSLGAITARSADQSMKSPLELACALCEPEILEVMLADPESKQHVTIYQTLVPRQPVIVNCLFWVVAGGSRFARLIYQGPDFETKTKRTIRLLTEAGVACDSVLRCGTLRMTATFAIAYHQCNVDILRSGLEYGFKYYLQSTFADASSGGPAMSLAIAHKDRDMFLCLLEAGASINWRNKYGQDALALACKEVDDVWFVEQLLQRGAVVDKGPHWPFWSAVYCGNLKVAKFLWDRGAQRDCRDQAGMTVLGHLITLRTRAAVERISFVLGLPDRDEGDGFEVLHSPDITRHRSSALHVAVSPLTGDEPFVEDPEMMERCRLTVATLMQKYGSPEYVNSTCGPHYDVPIAMAVEIGNHHAVRLLLEAGANPNEEDEYGRTAMDKNNFRLCFPTSIEVISSVSPDDQAELSKRLNFVNNNTREMHQLLTSYDAKTSVFRFPSWYEEDPGLRSLAWVTAILRARTSRPQMHSTVPTWGGMPIRIPERPMQFEAQRLLAETREHDAEHQPGESPRTDET